jgi:hypothetical protein
VVCAVLRAFLPGWALNAVLVIHSEEGLLAILFIFSIHFVNTHLRPDSFPMDMVIFTGVESEEEFKHKRPEEYAAAKARGKLEGEDWAGSGDVAGSISREGDWVHGDLDWADAAGADAECLTSASFVRAVTNDVFCKRRRFTNYPFSN